MKIASVQLNASSDKNENLRKIVSYIELASKDEIDLILFPEYSMFYTLEKERIKNLAEPLTGNFAGTIRDVAKSNNLNVITNINEKSIKNIDRIYDTSVLISRNGEILSIYRKTHLFDAFDSRESDFMIPGNSISKSIQIEDFNIGLLICYDIRFPENARVLALEGCTLLCVTSAWFAGVLKETHLLTMLRARAIENGFYVAMANQTYPTFCGRSTIIDPFGVTLADAGEENGKIIYAELSFERVENVRRELPQLKQRRPNLYYNLTL